MSKQSDDVLEKVKCLLPLELTKRSYFTGREKECVIKESQDEWGTQLYVNCDNTTYNLELPTTIRLFLLDFSEILNDKFLETFAKDCGVAKYIGTERVSTVKAKYCITTLDYFEMYHKELFVKHEFVFIVEEKFIVNKLGYDYCSIRFKYAGDRKYKMSRESVLEDYCNRAGIVLD